MTDSSAKEAGTHGALMDAIYRQQRHIYDITRKYYLLGRDRLVDELDPAPGSHVLEVACGTGRNLAKIAHRHPGPRLYGFDISAAMLQTARASLARQDLAPRVTLAEGDACAFDPQALFGVEKFERIVMSYCLSMIPDWEGATTEAVRHLAPGGTLAIVDFGEQTGLPGWFRRGLRRWLAQFHVEPRAWLPDLLERLARETGGTVTISKPYRDYAIYARLTLPA